MALEAVYPSKAPRAIPPPASNKNNLDTELKVAVNVLSVAIFKTTANITTATPSLNKDSPVILVSIDLGTFACFKIPSTTIGSVGDIKVPKSKQYIYGISIPKSGAIKYKSPDTIKADKTTDTVA